MDHETCFPDWSPYTSWPRFWLPSARLAYLISFSLLPTFPDVSLFILGTSHRRSCQVSALSQSNHATRAALAHSQTSFHNCSFAASINVSPAQDQRPIYWLTGRLLGLHCVGSLCCDLAPRTAEPSRDGVQGSSPYTKAIVRPQRSISRGRSGLKLYFEMVQDVLSPSARDFWSLHYFSCLDSLVHPSSSVSRYSVHCFCFTA
jgi:hypothetical protein